MALFEDIDDSRSLFSSWDLLVCLAYFAFGCFSVKLGPGAPARRPDLALGDAAGRAARRERTTPEWLRSSRPGILAGIRKKGKPGTTRPGETKQGKGKWPHLRFPEKKKRKLVHFDIVDDRSDKFRRIPSAVRLIHHRRAGPRFCQL
ncbi:hypothetical protein V2A60_010399 [Cordyceps javanica]